MARAEPAALRDWLGSPTQYLRGADADFRLGDLLHGSPFGADAPDLAGRSVLVATRSQLATALALIELDGVARRLTICPSDLAPEHFPAIIACAGAEAVVFDGDAPHEAVLGVPVRVACAAKATPTQRSQALRRRTEWLLLTSGTTGVPKIVEHSVAGLTAAIKPTTNTDMVWGTFYDIRRYGGLQIFLRAVLGGVSLVLSSAGEPVGEHLARLARHGVTHISGTPSHWRRVLWSPAAGVIAPRYVRLSGEVADQAILDNLRAVYPHANVGHAYASTEAGVGFEVDDGREGFPASMVGEPRDGVTMKVADDTLRIRSPRAATRYVGAQAAPLTDADDFVDTGDIVELRGERYYFIGRKGGIINVGGLKVHPEEVETVINRHPDVRMSLVRAQKNPITGAIVVADVVLAGVSGGEDEKARLAQVKNEIFEICREGLARHKVPVTISFVPALAVAPTGKLARRYA